MYVPPLVLSYGLRPGPSPLTTFDPDDLTLGLKVTLFCYPFCLGLNKQTKEKKKKNKLLTDGNCDIKMCPDPIHLTLHGESVVECAEFLITTLLTFLLFGNQIFKGPHCKIFYLEFYFYVKMCLQLF